MKGIIRLEKSLFEILHETCTGSRVGSLQLKNRSSYNQDLRIQPCHKYRITFYLVPIRKHNKDTERKLVTSDLQGGLTASRASHPRLRPVPALQTALSSLLQSFAVQADRCHSNVVPDPYPVQVCMQMRQIGPCHVSEISQVRGLDRSL